MTQVLLIDRMDEQNFPEDHLLQELLKINGPLIGGSALTKALGYSSSEAFRQACFRGNLPVRVFSIPKRRGKFAFTRDVAKWLAALEKQAKECDMNSG